MSVIWTYFLALLETASNKKKKTVKKNKNKNLLQHSKHNHVIEIKIPALVVEHIYSLKLLNYEGKNYIIYIHTYIYMRMCVSVCRCIK